MTSIVTPTTKLKHMHDEWVLLPDGSICVLVQVHARLVAQLALDLAAAVVQRAHSIDQAAWNKSSSRPDVSCGLTSAVDSR